MRARDAELRGDDPAATSTATRDVDYEDLYARWERGNWRASEIDFSVDREHWQEFTDVEKRAALWNYAMFFHGEDAVARTLSPYIDAAPRQEQKYFLTTQQVDEARHSVFFGRFVREVIEVGDSVDDALDITRSQLPWGFKKTFERLDQMAEELRKDPSPPMLARGVVLYHIVIEAALAQTGQHLIERSLEGRDILPGFLSGMRNVALDEQRHIGFGVKLLSELIVDPECRAAAIEMLEEVLRYSIAVFVPPGWDRSYTEAFGFTLEEAYTEADRSLTTKLRSAGFTDEELMGVLNSPVQLSPEERSRRALVLLEAGVLGEKTGPPRADHDVLGLLFEGMEIAVDPKQAPRSPLTIQWDFSDAEPWYLHIENGSKEARQGRADRPDLVFRSRFEDWVDLAMERENPLGLFARGKVRVSSLPMLWKCRNLFA